MHPEKRNPGAARTAAGANVDVTINGSEDSDLRAAMQRRLALKLAAGAGLSVAVAAVLVVVALGDGRPA